MKNLNKTLILTTATLLFTFSVNAHEPSMHAKKAPAKADCSGYNKIIESGTKIDMTDPVMMAMMKKCKDQKVESEHDNTDGHKDKKAEMKCGGDMKKASKKVEEKVKEKAEEHDH